MSNLVNAGILPLVFANEADYDMIEQGDAIVIENVKEQIMAGDTLTALNKTKGTSFQVVLNVSDRQKQMLYAGGLLNYTKNNGQEA